MSTDQASAAVAGNIAVPFSDEDDGEEQREQAGNAEHDAVVEA